MSWCRLHLSGLHRALDFRVLEQRPGEVHVDLHLAVGRRADLLAPFLHVLVNELGRRVRVCKVHAVLLRERRGRSKGEQCQRQRYLPSKVLHVSLLLKNCKSGGSESAREFFTLVNHRLHRPRCKAVADYPGWKTKVFNRHR